LTLAAVLAGAVLICASSVVVGQAVWRVAGCGGWSWLAGPVGLATLLAVALPAVSLPGAGATGAVALLVVLVASLLIVRGDLLTRDAAETALVLALGLLVASLPFIVTGRVGLLGVGDNADLSAHLLLAEGIANGRDPVGIDAGWYGNYPTGPHALIGSLHRGLGLSLEAGFTGLLMATLALSASAALSLLREAPRSRRAVGALVAGIPYLAASYTIQASFKETILGALVLTWTLALLEVAPALRSRQRAVVPLGFLAAGAYADYSFVALAWLAAVAFATAAAYVLRERRLPRLAASPRWAIAPALFAAVVALALVPQLDRSKALAGAVKVTAGGETTGGNIRAEIPFYEVFGAWPSSDLRAFGAGMAQLRVLSLFAACVALWAGIWWWRRRRPALPAAALALLIVYAMARWRTTPYYTAKALEVAAFAFCAMGVSAVLLALPPLERLRRAGPRTGAAALAGLAFVGLLAWSSALTLRGARVAPSEHRRELESLRPLLEGNGTLFMAQGDFMASILHGVPVSFPYAYIGNSQIAFDQRPEKSWAIPRLFDFDSVVAATLDRFRYVVSPRTPYASAPPANWKRARTTRWFVVYERHGPTEPRQVLPETGATGAVMDCSVEPGAILRQQKGEAGVLPAPVIVRWRELHSASGKRLAVGQYGLGGVRTGGNGIADVRLPPGRYDLSLQYVSPTRVELNAGGAHLELPPSFDGAGAFWSAGTFTSPGGRVQVRFHPRATSPLATFRSAAIGRMAFTRAGARERIVPLRKTCGRYVDWYRVREDG
jgi:hypothetical protein